MTSQSTELQLKLALAKELPELIDIIASGSVPRGQLPIWKTTSANITPREWDWIVRECEKKIWQNKDLWNKYIFYIQDSRGDDGLHAPWQTRAIAYFKTIGKEIE